MCCPSHKPGTSLLASLENILRTLINRKNEVHNNILPPCEEMKIKLGLLLYINIVLWCYNYT